jgi:hypothetical protein
LKVTAVNHDEQEVPADADFYFTVLASMYWFMKTRESTAPFCAYGDEASLPPPAPLASVALYDKYIARLEEDSFESYQAFLLEDYYDDVSEILVIGTIKTARSEHNCAVGTVRLKSEEPSLLAFLAPGLTLSTVFDAGGLDEFRSIWS